MIDRERYESYVAILADEVARLSQDAASLQTSTEVAASSGPNDRSIRPSIELRFCLVRHWNLYDAMYHSGYVAGRLKLWKERGRKNLQGFLAKMGFVFSFLRPPLLVEVTDQRVNEHSFSLQQCQQTYAHMDSDLKDMLYDKVDQLAPEYGLDDLTFPSFYRKSGYRSDISSSDAVEGLGALLEVATGVRLDFGTGADAVSGAGGREEWKAEGMRRWIDGEAEMEMESGGGEQREKGVGGEEEEEENAIVKAEKLEIDWGTRNFWLAWDALSNEYVFILRRRSTGV